MKLTKETVYRYMRLNNIQSIIRKKKNRYSQVEHHKLSNHLRRDFTTSKPNEKWSIDVSYLHCTNRTMYLCAIKDIHDKSVVAYHLSRFNDNVLVFDTIKKELSVVSVRTKGKLNTAFRSGQSIHIFSIY